MQHLGHQVFDIVANVDVAAPSLAVIVHRMTGHLAHALLQAAAMETGAGRQKCDYNMHIDFSIVRDSAIEIFYINNENQSRII